MDEIRFDRWSRHLARELPVSRRLFGAGVVATIAGLSTGSDLEAKKKRKKKKKKKKSTPTDGCPNGCSLNERCVGNLCVPGCISGTTPCGVYCCLNGAESCQNGFCVPLCSDLRPRCGSVCCSAGVACVNGSCGTACPAGRVTCGGQCCAAGETCDGLGRCSAPCGGGECPEFILDIEWSVTGLTGGSLDEPCGIDRDSSGNLYILDCGNDRVVKVASSGEYMTQWPAAGFGISVDGDETVYVANGGLVTKHTTGGTASGTLAGSFSNASDVSVAANGDVYVLQSSNVVRVARNGAPLGSFSPQPPASAFGFPAGIVVDDEVEEVIVANTLAHLIQRLDYEGVLDREFGGLSQCGGNGQPPCSDPLFNRQFRSPAGVAIDADGNVYIADFGNNRIVVVEEDSGYITQFGAGELDGPDSLVVDAAGNVFVADSRNNRVVKYVPANARERQRRIDERRSTRAQDRQTGNGRPHSRRPKRSRGNRH